MQETGSMKEIKPNTMLDFRNGWSICIHFIKDDEVYYQTWPSGVTSQPFWCRLSRTPLDIFEQRVSREREGERIARKERG